MQRILSLFCCSVAFIVVSCSPKYGITQDSKEPEARTAAVPDYSDLFYWAAHPAKHDPSDSVPAPLRNDMRRDSTVDVFFIHPTTFTSRQDSNWNADLNDAALNAKTDYSTILYQASAFNEYRVFAPRYRQANLRAYYTTGEQAKAAFDTAYEDVKNAFLYYMQHENAGRPIIIASHSQGTTHAERLLKGFFDGTLLAHQLVAAYIPGMYIPPHYFASLKSCNNPRETGCYVGWRTFKRGYEPDFVKKEKEKSVATNPLTWRSDTVYASYKMNKGGVTTKFNSVRKNITDGQLHDGILWIGRPRIPGSIFLKMKNFHVGDINLFYMNIRENLRERVEAFKSSAVNEN